MDKIYSRKRIKIPKIEGFGFKEYNSKTKNAVKISIMASIAIITAIVIIRALNPMFNTMCLERAKGIATDILNTEASQLLKDVDYEELVNIVRDDNGNINMLKINTIQINLLATNIAYNIQEELYKSENNIISIPIRKYYWKSLPQWIWT